MDTTWFHILTGTLENLYKERKTRRVEVDLSVSSLEAAIRWFHRRTTQFIIIKPQSSVQDKCYCIKKNVPC